MTCHLKLSCDMETLGALAAAMLAEHASLVSRGFRLTKASSYRLTERGYCTARFVYRHKSDSCAFTLRKLPVIWL